MKKLYNIIAALSIPFIDIGTIGLKYPGTPTMDSTINGLIGLLIGFVIFGILCFISFHFNNNWINFGLVMLAIVISIIITLT